MIFFHFFIYFSFDILILLVNLDLLGTTIKQGTL